MGSRSGAQRRRMTGDPLHRIAHGVLAEALAAIKDRKRGDVAAIHDFRKAMKQWRALLRLLEPSLGEHARRLRLRARDLAREFARPRDAKSALDALRDVIKHDSRLSPLASQAIRRRLDDVRRHAETSMLSGVIRRRIAAAIRSAQRAVDRWPVAEIGFADIVDGLTKSYRRTRRVIPDDWNGASAKDLHELRRRVIEHRYQMELMRRRWPFLRTTQTEETQRLRDRLGRYQDLVILSGLTVPGRLLAPWRSGLSKPIADRRAVHLASAAKLAHRLFSERPKAFCHRLRAVRPRGRSNSSHY